MKKRVWILLGISFLAVISTGLAVSANFSAGDRKKMAQPVEEEFITNNERKEMFTEEEFTQETEQMSNAQNELVIYNDIQETRMVSKDVGGEEYLTYEGTCVMEHSEIAQEEESYGIYDQYSDENESTYYYLHSSDKLCLYMEECEYVDTAENPVARNYSDSYVKSRADSYLTAVMGSDESKYSYQKTEYQGQKNIYLVTYIRRLGDYITDDILTVFLDENAEVYAFSALNRDRYENFQLEDIDEESLNRALNAVENGEYEMDDIRISMDADTQSLIAVLPQ